MGTAQYYNNATNTSDDGGLTYYLKRAPCDTNVSIHESLYCQTYMGPWNTGEKKSIKSHSSLI